MRPRQASTVSTALIVGSSLPEWPTMSALAKFTTMTSKLAVFDGLHHGVGDSGGAHFWFQIVSRDLL